MKSASAETKLAPSRTLSTQSALNCARIAAENKARDVVVLDLTDVTPLYDYFVIATGSSRRQIHNLAEQIDAAMAAEGQKRLGIEGYEAAKWVVQDYGDIVVHVFDKETRDYYELEELWADARKLEWAV
ncbi:MAG TPA: ribosome silencing factor [Gemmataceae bacterium]|nr:ribosome silencing factor [Gemmataceae bacterium]